VEGGAIELLSRTENGRGVPPMGPDIDDHLALWSSREYANGM